MKVFPISDKIAILRGEKDAEPKYRRIISARIIEKFGKGPYEPAIQKDVFVFCQQYYIGEFEKVSENETSYTFFREIFMLHEQATDLRKSEHFHQLPEGIDKSYIAGYRRILKLILEKGCDIDMQSGETRDLNFIRRIQPTLNDLLYLGEMIFRFTESYAEYSMVEGISQITFDELDLYQQIRDPHFDYVFSHISKDYHKIADEYIIDPSGFEDFKIAILQCFGLDYDQINKLMAVLYKKFNLDPPDCLSAERQNFITDLANICEVPRESAELFLSGLTLGSHNKMKLEELVRKPFSMNRFLARPFLDWTINQQSFLVCGIYHLDETENNLVFNAIPWGKFPDEWKDVPGIKTYVDRKLHEHDKWLDDQVESIIQECGLHYDRGVKTIQTKAASLSLVKPSPGEIDFLVISPATKKLLVTECKHLLGRYDMANWKQDYDHFIKNDPSGYNNRLTAKATWIARHLPEVEAHFRMKYNDQIISLDQYTVEGVFVINTPTFYMYNALLRIYTYPQYRNVITGQHSDPVYTLVVDDDDSITNYWVKYPYFAKREIVYFEPEDDGEEVDKYGFPIPKSPQ